MRHSAYQHFYQTYIYIVFALEVIALGLHRDDLSEKYSDSTWCPDSKSSANSLLHGVTNFDFVIVFLIIYQYLSHLSGITVKLQSTNLDILEAYQQIDEVKHFYEENIQENFSNVYQQAE